MPPGKYIRKGRPAIRPIGPSIAYLELTRGLFSLIDLSDAEELEKYKWCVFQTRQGSLYVYRSGAPCRAQSLHRYLLGLRKGDPLTGDHINLNTLDNRRSNLRIADRSQQCANRRKRSGNKSGIKGVSWDKKMKKWHAQLSAKTSEGKRNYHLGFYSDIQDAARAYAAKMIEVHGEFARL